MPVSIVGNMHKRLRLQLYYVVQPYSATYSPAAPSTLDLLAPDTALSFVAHTHTHTHIHTHTPLDTFLLVPLVYRNNNILLERRGGRRAGMYVHVTIV